MYFPGKSYRSPETKEEIKQATGVLNGLGIIFALVSLMGLAMVGLYHGRQYLIITVVFGGVSLLLFAARAYNRYYMRTMSHARFVAAALRNPMITVCLITLGLAALVAGFALLLIYFK